MIKINNFITTNIIIQFPFLYTCTFCIVLLIFYIYCIVSMFYYINRYCLLVSDDVVWNIRYIYIYLRVLYSTAIGRNWIFEMYMKCKCKAGTPLIVQCSSSRLHGWCHVPTYQYMSSLHSQAACDRAHVPTVLVMIQFSCPTLCLKYTYNKAPQPYLKHTGSMTKKLIC